MLVQEKRLRLEAGLPDGGCPMEILPALLRTPQEEEKRRGQVESRGQVSLGCHGDNLFTFKGQIPKTF